MKRNREREDEVRFADLERLIVDHGVDELGTAAALRLGGELLVVATDRPAVDDLTADGFTGRRLRDEDGFARLVAVVDEGAPDRGTVWGGDGVIWRAVTPVVWTLSRVDLPADFGRPETGAFLAVLRPPLAFWLSGKVLVGTRFKLSFRSGAGLVVEVETENGVRLGMDVAGGLR